MSFQELMARLQREYLESLPSKIAEIEQDCQDGELERLKVAFHKVKGTGKTYGLPEITQVAEPIEDILTHNRSQGIEAARIGIQLFKVIYRSKSAAKNLDIENEDGYLTLRQWAAQASSSRPNLS